jgi:hypothetical protein
MPFAFMAGHYAIAFDWINLWTNQVLSSIVILKDWTGRIDLVN